PEPLHYLAELGLVLQSAVPGKPLSAMSEGEDWSRPVRSVAENLAALHDLPASLAEPRTMAEHVRKFCHPGPDAWIREDPTLAPQVGEILRGLEAVGRSDDGPPCPVHGDLGLGQIFVDLDRAWFIDFDGVFRSHAAL